MATKSLKETNFLKYKAQCIRSSFRQRTKDPSVYIPPSKVYEEWLRSFGGVYVCYYSGVTLKESEFTVDHRIPLGRNGCNNVENLCICSKKMNDCKGALTDVEFFELLELLDKWEPIAKKNVLTRLKAAANIFRPNSK